MRREILYLEVTMFFFTNTKGLDRQEDSIGLINEKVVKSVGDKAWNERMLLIITKTNAGHKFYCTKFSVIDFFHTDRRSLFRYMAKIGLWQK